MTTEVTCSDGKISVDLGPLVISPILKDTLEKSQSIIIPFTIEVLNYLIDISHRIYVPVDYSIETKLGKILLPKKSLLSLFISAIRLADFLMLNVITRKFVEVITTKSSSRKFSRNPETLVVANPYQQRTILNRNITEIVLSREHVMNLGEALIYRIAKKLPADKAKSFLSKLDENYPDQMRSTWDQELALKSMTSLKKTKFFSLETCGQHLIELSFNNPAILKLLQNEVEEGSDLWNDMRLLFMKDLISTINGDSNQRLLHDKEEFMTHMLKQEWLCRLYTGSERNLNIKSSYQVRMLLTFARNESFTILAVMNLINIGYHDVIADIISGYFDQFDYEVDDDVLAKYES